MLPWLGAGFGNPASDHPLGRAAREAVDRARAQVASLIGAKDDEILFTASATEANNLALLGTARALAQAGRGRHLIASAVEHPAVRAPLDYLETQGIDALQIRLTRIDERIHAAQRGGQMAMFQRCREADRMGFT